MPGVQVETHTLALNDEQEAKVVVWDNGDVDLYLDEVRLTVENLSNFVEFVEAHGNVTVVE